MNYFSNSPLEIDADSISAKAVLFVRENKVLLLQKPSGAWDLPGGKLEGDEGWIEGLAREIYEESGLRIDRADWLTSWQSTRTDNTRVLKAIFLCRLDCEPKKSRITVSDEHVKGNFFSLKKVKALSMAEEYARAIDQAAQKIGA